MSNIPALQNNDKIAIEMFAAIERERKDHRRYLGMSEIGKTCDRSIWFSFRGFPKAPIEGRILMIFEMGDMIETQVVRLLNSAGFKVEGQQDGYKAHNGFFRGHSDGTVHGVTSRPHILEVKSANDKRFAAFKKFGVRNTYPTYFCQAQCYMGYSGLERTLFVIVNKNNSDIYTERVYFSKDDFDALNERAHYIITANAMPEIGEDCDWCDYKSICKDLSAGLYTKQTCGSCHAMYWKDLTPRCAHPLHPHEIEEWGTSCPDWTLYKNVDYLPF